jgi:hypothetical protein
MPVVHIMAHLRAVSPMLEPIRRGLRHWADHSTGLGMLARRWRRPFLERRPRLYRTGNIAMLHAGRCGSSVLADLLDQRDDVRWVGEPFESLRPAYYRMDSSERARQIIGDAMWRVRTAYFGFDTKYLPEQHLRPELANCSPEEYITLLRELGFTHFILLDRRNHLRRAISTAIGARNGVWNSFQPVPEAEPIRLDPLRFVSYGREMPLLDHFAALEATYGRLRQCLEGQRLLELTYEDHIERDPRAAYELSCAFLGLAPRPVEVRLQRLNPRRPEHLLANFTEIEALLKGTRYEWMLYDGPALPM